MLVLFGRGRLVEAAQTAGPVDVRDSGAFDEDLLDVGALEQIGQRPVLGERPGDSSDHLAGVAECSLVTDVGAALVLLHRSRDHLPDRVDIGVGVEALLLDELQRPAADVEIGVAALTHAATSGTKRSTHRSRAFRNRPLPTRVPSHAARSTTSSLGMKPNDAGW